MFNKDINQLLTLVKEAGNIDGRKKFQKIVYILQQKGVKMQERFKYHYYGPFSSDLQLEIDELVDRKILTETSSIPYSYSINPEQNFEEIIEIIEKKDLIEFLNKQDVKILELTSTIYFLNKEGLTDKTIITKRLKNLKPHLSSLIEESFELQEVINNMN